MLNAVVAEPELGLAADVRAKLCPALDRLVRCKRMSQELERLQRGGESPDVRQQRIEWLLAEWRKIRGGLGAQQGEHNNVPDP